MHHSATANTTFSLPLDRDWTNDTVELRAIEWAPQVLDPLLWQDDETSSIYFWGGTENFEPIEIGSDFWAFTPDGRAGGSWAQRNSGNPSVFRSIIRASGRAFTTCNGIGYGLGGRTHSLEDPRSPVQSIMNPELVTYTMNTSMWANESLDGFTYKPYLGEASCLPSFGTEGVVAFYGTVRTELNSEAHFQDFEFSTFETIALYDPANKRWHWQSTTGDAPAPMMDFCSVSVQSPTGSIEM